MYNITRLLIYKIIFPFIFRLFSFFSVNKFLVLFVVYNFDKLPLNMNLIYNICIKHGYSCKLFLKFNKDQYKFIIYRYIKQFLFIYNFLKYYAYSKYVVLDDYYPYLYFIKPRKNVKIVQLWHGCGAFKKFGYSCINKKWDELNKSHKYFPIHNTYTDVFVSSPIVIPYYKEAFNCDVSIIKPLGVPRTDYYFNIQNINSALENIKKTYTNIENRKIILYAPTFRGIDVSFSVFTDKIDYNYLASLIKNDYVLLVKYHPFAKKIIKQEITESLNNNFLYDITNSFTIENSLCAADIVISDYSSLIFEYSLLERPMIFFTDDLDSYDDERGFYFPYKDFVPGPIVNDTESLVNAIHNAYSQDNIKKVKAFKEKFMSSCDGNSTERIYNYIFKINNIGY